MSNVVPLFKEPEENKDWGSLAEVMESYTTWAARQGADTNSTKFLYECATIMTLMQIAAAK